MNFVGFIVVTYFSVQHLVYAAPKTCHLGKTFRWEGKISGSCAISGHSESGMDGRKTFYISCEGNFKNLQIEYVKGGKSAQLVEMDSRRKIADCELSKSEADQLIQTYELKSGEIENPKCLLSQWKGQMAFTANRAHGRCSFKMNSEKAEEFKRKTGQVPLYQCEGQYFLVGGDKSASTIFKKNGDSWEVACQASIKVGDPVDLIDWKNPPNYYDPEHEELGP